MACNPPTPPNKNKNKTTAELLIPRPTYLDPQAALRPGGLGPVPALASPTDCAFSPLPARSEVQKAVNTAQGLFQRWTELLQDPSGATREEVDWTTNELRNNLRSIEWDLEDLDETINILSLEHAQAHAREQAHAPICLVVPVPGGGPSALWAWPSSLTIRSGSSGSPLQSCRGSFIPGMSWASGGGMLRSGPWGAWADSLNLQWPSCWAMPLQGASDTERSRRTSVFTLTF